VPTHRPHLSRPHLSRRRFLAAGLLGGTVAAVAAVTQSDALAVVLAPGHPSTATTPNGWPVVTPSAVRQLTVQGSDARVAVLPGAVATVLLYVLRRYHYEVDALGAADVVGHLNTSPGRAAFEANHLSGTAVTVHPGRHPVGATRTLFPLQLLKVRDILAECDSVVRWGGDDRDHPAEGFFQIDVPAGDPALSRVAAKIAGWDAGHGQGAGSPVDLLDPARRLQATHLERRQRGS
jgi:hypothetical protein